jgi:hypothetical protein
VVRAAEGILGVRVEMVGAVMTRVEAVMTRLGAEVLMLVGTTEALQACGRRG